MDNDLQLAMRQFEDTVAELSEAMQEFLRALAGEGFVKAAEPPTASPLIQ